MSQQNHLYAIKIASGLERFLNDALKRRLPVGFSSPESGFSLYKIPVEEVDYFYRSTIVTWGGYDPIDPYDFIKVYRVGSKESKKRMSIGAFIDKLNINRSMSNIATDKVNHAYFIECIQATGNSDIFSTLNPFFHSKVFSVENMLNEESLQPYFQTYHIKPKEKGFIFTSPDGSRFHVQMESIPDGLEYFFKRTPIHIQPEDEYTPRILNIIPGYHLDFKERKK